MDRVKPYLFVAPSIIIFCTFFIYPILYMLYLSFFDWNFVTPDMDFLGFANYLRLFNDPIFIQVIQNSFIYTFLVVFFTITLGLLTALWLNNIKFMSGFLQGAIFSPHVIALVSIAMLWMWIMDDTYGLLNWFLSLFGIEPVGWLTDPDVALYSLAIVAIWKGIGYNALVFIAGLQSIPKDLYEAADLDNAGPMARFFKITLPMLSPSLFFLTVINMIASLQVFDTINIMTQGGPVNSTNQFVYFIYENGFRYFSIGYASAAGVVLFIIIGVLTLLYFLLLSKRVHYR